MLRSCSDMSMATQAKYCCTNSVDSVSLSGTRCCQRSLRSTNSAAHAGSHLHIAYAYTDVQSETGRKTAVLSVQLRVVFEN